MAAAFQRAVFHLACRLSGNLFTKQPADDVQAHVDPSGNPGRADDPSIVHKTAI
jgi:hypothetical protein